MKEYSLYGKGKFMKTDAGCQAGANGRAGLDSLPLCALSFDDYKKLHATVSPAMTMDTILISLMRMLRLGPEVSLNGSPTVSPTTVALWFSDPFPP